MTRYLEGEFGQPDETEVRKSLISNAASLFRRLTGDERGIRDLVDSDEGFNVKVGENIIGVGSLESRGRLLLGYSLYLGFWVTSGQAGPVVIDDPFGRLSELHRLVLSREIRRLSGRRQLILLSGPLDIVDIDVGNVIDLDAVRAEQDPTFRD